MRHLSWMRITRNRIREPENPSPCPEKRSCFRKEKAIVRHAVACFDGCQDNVLEALGDPPHDGYTARGVSCRQRAEMPYSRYPVEQEMREVGTGKAILDDDQIIVEIEFLRGSQELSERDARQRSVARTRKECF